MHFAYQEKATADFGNNSLKTLGMLDKIKKLNCELLIVSKIDYHFSVSKIVVY